MAQQIKKSACNEGDTGDTSSIPGLGGPPGEGNGNPLQYSCLGNPMHRGAWRATVHGVAKSWTRLSDWEHSTQHTEGNPPGCDRRGSTRQVKLDQCLLRGTCPPTPPRDKDCHGRRWTLAFFPLLTSTNSWLIQREWLTAPEAAGQLFERGVHGEASSTCYSFSLSLHIHRGP